MKKKIFHTKQTQSNAQILRVKYLRSKLTNGKNVTEMLEMLAHIKKFANSSNPSCWPSVAVFSVNNSLPTLHNKVICETRKSDLATFPFRAKVRKLSLFYFSEKVKYCPA